MDTASTLVWPSVAAQHWPQHCPPHPPTISPTSTHGSLSSGPFSVVETPNPSQMSTLHVAAIRAPPPTVYTCQQAHLFNAHPPRTLRIHTSITLHPPDHFFQFMDRSKALYQCFLTISTRLVCASSSLRGTAIFSNYLHIHHLYCPLSHNPRVNPYPWQPEVGSDPHLVRVQVSPK